MVHVGVTRSPSDAWVAQQLREATPEDGGPRFLIHDHDAKYGPAVARVAAASGIEVTRTPIRAPRANAVCERFLGSVRRECVDHTLILGERHLSRVLSECVGYFNRARPHQGIGQRTPLPSAPVGHAPIVNQDVIAVPSWAGCITSTDWRRNRRGWLKEPRQGSGGGRRWPATPSRSRAPAVPSPARRPSATSQRASPAPRRCADPYLLYDVGRLKSRVHSRRLVPLMFTTAIDLYSAGIPASRSASKEEFQ
jgi:hypothetical protein